MYRDGTSGQEDEVRGAIATMDDVTTLGHALLAGAGQVGHALPGEGQHARPALLLHVQRPRILNRRLHTFTQRRQTFIQRMSAFSSQPAKPWRHAGLQPLPCPCSLKKMTGLSSSRFSARFGGPAALQRLCLQAGFLSRAQACKERAGAKQLTLYAPAVSLPSPGRSMSTLGMARKEARCSMG